MPETKTQDQIEKMQKKSNAEWQASASVWGGNASYLESLYEEYLRDPAGLADEWQTFFQNQTRGAQAAISLEQLREQLRQWARAPHQFQPAPQVPESAIQCKVDALIDSYRKYGHLQSQVNPLGYLGQMDTTQAQVRLTLDYHGLTKQHLTDNVLTRGVLPSMSATLQSVLDALQQAYCGSLAIELNYVTDTDTYQWLRERIEKRSSHHLAADQQQEILQQLIVADELEKYLDMRFKGQKRFSLEGGDSLIPLLKTVLEHTQQQHIQEVVLCMAHRGRLNVLINVLGKKPQELFAEFEGNKEIGLTSGDVKYHMGYSNDVATKSGPLHVSMAFNPSHLEIISPILMGSVRARQDAVGDCAHDYALGVVVHGDAAFAGQGIAMEILNMSETRAYAVGGCVHIILNNQIGFTTSERLDARTARYCSDVAKMIEAPVLHVNGDDPEAVVFAGELAMAYRMQFHRDVLIDLVCYRRHGHQEVDEPRATQGLLYQFIEKHPVPAALYTQQLQKIQIKQTQEINNTQDAKDANGIKDAEKIIDVATTAKQLRANYREQLEKGEVVVELADAGIYRRRFAIWEKFLNQNWHAAADTAVSLLTLQTLGERLSYYPAHFQLLRQIEQVMVARKKMTRGEQLMDWGFAESMAYATLLDQGYTVRMSGQDCRRGTFFHRHAFLQDQKTGQTYMPLAHLSDKQAQPFIYDSLLSEAGAMGFEYGYAATDPNALVIWEGQFGDFANGAQVIIDQFISSAWQKWQRLSGLVLFLPHGYEGGGPEHSSARLERYLQLCAQENIQVCMPTTPAQIFHLLRRQMLRPYRTPLIVMTPKSMLRNKQAVSPLSSLASGAFQTIIPESETDIQATAVTQVVICSGKVYYDLLNKRKEIGANTVAIVRLEQLYPFPQEELKSALSIYIKLKKIVWCQEEPMNQGAWYCIYHQLVKCVGEKQTLEYAGRAASASPAVGYLKLHQQQQDELAQAALKVG